MNFDGDFDRPDPRPRGRGDDPPRGREDEYEHPFAPGLWAPAAQGGYRPENRPAPLSQADGEPYGGPGRGGARPPGSYGELNYRDEDSPRGVPHARGRFAGRGPKGFQRSDESLRERASEALERHGDVDASEIEVRVASGEVTLAGAVTDRRSKRLAEDCVLEIPGVRDVHNLLRVVP